MNEYKYAKGIRTHKTKGVNRRYIQKHPTFIYFYACKNKMMEYVTFTSKKEDVHSVHSRFYIPNISRKKIKKL